MFEPSFGPQHIAYTTYHINSFGYIIIGKYQKRKGAEQSLLCALAELTKMVIEKFT